MYDKPPSFNTYFVLQNYVNHHKHAYCAMYWEQGKLV